MKGKDSIVFEDENVYICPDISPIVLGHFLIISKHHYSCFGKSEKDVHISVEKAKSFLKHKIFTSKDLLFFEHGSVIEHSAGSCIDHAHIHVIPNVVSVDVDQFIEKCGFIYSNKFPAEFSQLQELAALNQPYIYYEVGEKKWAYKVDQLPSQFFRFMVASYISKGYNWKTSYSKPDSKELFSRTLNIVKGDKLLIDLGEHSVVKDVIYNAFPYLRSLHDDAVIVDVRDVDQIVTSIDPCPHPVLNYFDSTNYYFNYGVMSVLINYSDIAAMGASPTGILLSTIMPNSMTVTEYEGFLKGVKFACDKWGGKLLGGNVKDGPEFSVTGTSFGKVVKGHTPIRRKGANVGDRVCVVGEMGLFWVPVLEMLSGKDLSDLDGDIAMPLTDPYPKTREGLLLGQSNMATCCMDSSDGVIGCLFELAEINDSTIVLDNDKLIPSPILQKYCYGNSIDHRNLMLAWGGWELVFTCADVNLDCLKLLFQENSCSFSTIGTVMERSDVLVKINDRGVEYSVDDFSSKRFNSTSYFTAGLSKYINYLKCDHIKEIR